MIEFVKNDARHTIHTSKVTNEWRFIYKKIFFIQSINFYVNLNKGDEKIYQQCIDEIDEQ